MIIKNYRRMYLPSGSVATGQFDESHYSRFNIRNGVPRLIALELVNDWNRQSSNFKFWLDS